MSGISDVLEEMSKKWANQFSWISLFAVAGLMLLAVVDIVSSKVFRLPVPGGMDLIGLFLLIVSAFAVAHTQVLRRHIVVDFFLMRLPQKARNFINIISSFLTLLVSLLLILASLINGTSLLHSNELSMTLLIPLFPFAFAIAVALFPLFLVLLTEFIQAIRGRRSI